MRRPERLELSGRLDPRGWPTRARGHSTREANRRGVAPGLARVLFQRRRGLRGVADRKPTVGDPGHPAEHDLAVPAANPDRNRTRGEAVQPNPVELVPATFE